MIGTRKATKRSNRECGFCADGKGVQYIYPLPEKYRKKLNIGLMACGKCFPAIRQAQLDEGIMLPPDPPRIDIVKWKQE